MTSVSTNDSLTLNECNFLSYLNFILIKTTIKINIFKHDSKYATFFVK